MHTSGVERPGRPRRRIAVDVAIVLACLTSGSLASQAARVRVGVGQDGAPFGAGGNGILLLSWACAVLLCFRRRPGYLLPITLIACVPPLLFPTDALAALIGLSSVLVHLRSRPGRGAALGAVTAATFAATWRDTRGTRHGGSFWNDLFHSQDATGYPPMPLWHVAGLSLACVACSVGVALLRRSRRDTARADARADAATRTADDLGRQIAEQERREHLAREVHDVLGHRLSLLSMQANALEAEAADASPDLQERARAIQHGAAGSMNDLRSLLTMLREPSPPPAESGRADLSDLADLVRECIAAGTPVASNIFVDRSAPWEETISRAARRVTRELLTNARKHAPGATVVLEVHGDPNTGLDIATSNPLLPGVTGVGTGSGLDDVAERVAALGGSFEAGPSPDGRRFLATAHLPPRPNHPHPQERR